jgi:hypothetical protein
MTARKRTAVPAQPAASDTTPPTPTTETTVVPAQPAANDTPPSTAETTPTAPSTRTTAPRKRAAAPAQPTAPDETGAGSRSPRRRASTRPAAPEIIPGIAPTAPRKRATKARPAETIDLFEPAEPTIEADTSLSRADTEVSPADTRPADTGPSGTDVTGDDAAGPAIDIVTEPPTTTIPTGEPATTAIENTLRTRVDLPSDADLTRAVRGRPQLVTAALAVAAVGRFGESARTQAEWLHATYPRVTSRRLAQDAVRTANRRARYAVGSTLLGGPLGIAAGVSTMAWAHARLVIDIAAIFGRDPLDPGRAADVLVLLGAYPDRLAAGKAVAELAGDYEDIEALDAKAPAPMIVSTAAQALTKAAGRILPGTAVIAAAIRGSSETERLATRAIRYFQQAAER